MKTKKGQVAIIVAIIIGAIIIGGSVVYFATNSGSGITGEVTQDTIGNSGSQDKNCKEVETPYQEQEEYYETVPYNDNKCIYRDYDSKGGYLVENYQTGEENKYDWLIYGLFYANGEPNLETVQKYYVTNYENKLGTFGIKINYVDDNNDYLESFIYHSKQVGPKETETGYISYTALWQNKPGQANGFYISLDKPTYEECEPTTEYQDVLRTRTVTKYKTETVCE